MRTSYNVGTSGWIYNDWSGRFYPADLPPNKRLNFLAQQFNTVEINSSFYRLPLRQTISRWRDETPDDFVLPLN